MKQHFKTRLTFVLLFTTALAKAQWSGPTSGILSTSNSVRISKVGGSSCQGCPTPAPLFETQLTGGTGGALYPFHITHSGKVGIGTNTPGATFHIANSGDFRMSRANVAASPIFTIDASGKCVLTTDGGAFANRGFFISNGTSNILTATPESFTYSFSNKEVFKLDANVNLKGDIIVSDLNNDIQFRVYMDGLVRAREVRVNLAVIPPDYVFEKNYRLLPIADLEIYINANKHLPNIPSAKEMTDEGTVNVGELQFQLLEKVEELTLYLIQLKKENEELQKRVCALEGQE